ncbi:MAG: DUF1894 domain-containing protein [Methanosarcinales archaeon]|nr:DUF1894 domain-containing protein [Methanosarcinales archaeon]
MGCIEEITYEILLSKVTFKKCSAFIRSNFNEVYIIPPGYRMFNVFIIGVPPIYVGISGDNITFPYTKPCHGTFVMKTQSQEEVKKVQKTGKPVM